MADEETKEGKETAGAVGEDFDQFFDRIKERNKNYKYEDGLNADKLAEVSSVLCCVCATLHVSMPMMVLLLIQRQKVFSDA